MTRFKFRISVPYLLCALLLLVVEILIALYVHDRFVRPTIGDLLVVILLYCLVRGFSDMSVNVSAAGVLLFSFLVEGLQYLHLVKLLGLQGNKFANILIGNTFQWTDLVAYTMGIIIVVIAERVYATRANTSSSQP